MSRCRAMSKARAQLGECILWDDRGGLLWWTDILAQRLFQLNLETGTERFWILPAKLGSFALTKQQDTLLLGLDKALAFFNFSSNELRWLCEIEPDLPLNRVNDGRCDRHGNFVFGTMNEGGDEALGGWYRYSADGHLQRLALPACHIANSICFSLDGFTMYFSDSPTAEIYCCDYEPFSGETSRIRLFHNLASRYATGEVPNPDGSIIDAEGMLWNAEWGGGCISRYWPDGRLDQCFELPVSQPTCLTFGGSDLDVLYISSAYAQLDKAKLEQAPDEGQILQLQAAGFSGLREARFGESWVE